MYIDSSTGVTRRSILELAREWNEFEASERWLTMKEVQKAAKEGRVRWLIYAHCLPSHYY
jgi:branched-chain amino acid aminotransferase